MIKALKVLPVIGGAVSLYFIITSAMKFEAGTISLGQAALMIFTFGAVLYISYVAYQDIKALKECPGSHKTKGTDENTQLNYTPDTVNYASSFCLGEPVVTTEEYYEGAGYHAFIEAFDRTDIGRPFKIRMCGSLGTDWVSIDEIVPDIELEVSI